VLERTVLQVVSIGSPSAIAPITAITARHAGSLGKIEGIGILAQNPTAASLSEDESGRNCHPGPQKPPGSGLFRKNRRPPKNIRSRPSAGRKTGRAPPLDGPYFPGSRFPQTRFAARWPGAFATREPPKFESRQPDQFHKHYGPITRIVFCQDTSKFAARNFFYKTIDTEVARSTCNAPQKVNGNKRTNWRTTFPARVELWTQTSIVPRGRQQFIQPGSPIGKSLRRDQANLFFE
jgi:hypothetical protein